MEVRYLSQWRAITDGIDIGQIRPDYLPKPSYLEFAQKL
jgi:hypothetical protein